MLKPVTLFFRPSPKRSAGPARSTAVLAKVRTAWHTRHSEIWGDSEFWGRKLWLGGIVPQGFRHAVASQPWWLYTVGLINLPAIVLGFPLETIAGFIAFRGVWAVYIHSNVRLPLGPFRVLLGSPEIHHWHHDRDRDAGNYANLSPLMDVLFGTYRCPDHEPERFGLDEPAPGTYLGHMVEPFLPRRSSP